MGSVGLPSGGGLRWNSFYNCVSLSHLSSIRAHARTRTQRTCVLRRDYLHYIKKYNRFEKRHKNISAHVSPCFLDIALGDKVRVRQRGGISLSLSRSRSPLAAVLVVLRL